MDNAVSSRTSDRRQDLAGLVGFLALTIAVEIVAGLATSSSVRTWYPTLEKAPWNPPGWVFGPVWTVLYVMMAVAAWRVWRYRKGDERVRQALGIFYLQLTLNFLWSILFFGLQLPLAGLIDIVLLLTAIILTTIVFRRIDRWAAWLMIPYALWVAYATTLNAAIWWLNR
ncbi:MAG: tryptophan-rich sensory protein [candidate division Zixibacteria bacterium]|nr:tryptophan-rich sensory protein [candidate division Zixibacteria bacterium]